MPNCPHFPFNEVAKRDENCWRQQSSDFKASLKDSKTKFMISFISIQFSAAAVVHIVFRFEAQPHFPDIQITLN